PWRTASTDPRPSPMRQSGRPRLRHHAGMLNRPKAAFVFIFITVLLDMVSFGVIIPVFPQLILKLQGGDMAGAAAVFGIFGTAFGIGFIVGPAIGGLLGAIDLRAPFWAAAVLSITNFLYGVFILPESLPAERRRPFSVHAANPIGAVRFLGSRPVLLSLTVAM